MDSLIASAAQSLARGDPLGALKRVALRNDPSALALRGIAMAQLGDYARSRDLLRRAARRFGPQERLAQARCRVAEAEVALAARDLTGSAPTLVLAARVLDAHGDHANALHARLVDARRQLILGQINSAAHTLGVASAVRTAMPAALIARLELTRAELALRQVRVADASAALTRARATARRAAIPALLAEIERTQRALAAPAARILRGGAVDVLRLADVETLFTSDHVIVDGCRRCVRRRDHTIPLAGRPVLFELARALAEAWPNDAARDTLISRIFATRGVNDSHRSRLRVEIGRLRALLRPLARLDATATGYLLAPINHARVIVLVPPVDGPAGAILALLEDGESWSTSALANALGSSQRTVQRTLRELDESAAVRSVGHGRSRRWLAPALGGFATALLLPAPPSLG